MAVSPNAAQGSIPGPDEEEDDPLPVVVVGCGVDTAPAVEEMVVADVGQTGKDSVPADTMACGGETAHGLDPQLTGDEDEPSSEASTPPEVDPAPDDIPAGAEGADGAATATAVSPAEAKEPADEATGVFVDLGVINGLNCTAEDITGAMDRALQQTGPIIVVIIQEATGDAEEHGNQAEMAHTCRGTINLANAFIHTEDSCSFVISNGGTQTFHLKASSEVERQRWVTALELAKSKAITLMESDEEDEDTGPDKNELQNQLRTLGSKLEDLNTCNDLIIKHGAALQRSLSELEQLEAPTDAANQIKAVNERATLFRITSNAMINACTDYLDLAQTQGKRWQKMLAYEHEQRLRLEEMVEQLAKQHSSFEKQARKSLAYVAAGNHLSKITDGNQNKDPSAEDGEDEEVDDPNETYTLLYTRSDPRSCIPIYDEEDDEDCFYDAVDTQTEEFKVCLPPGKGHRRSGSGISIDSLSAQLASPTVANWDSSDSDSEKAEANVISPKGRMKDKHRRNASQDSSRLSANNAISPVIPCRLRRKSIPEKPNYSLNLWSIMKNCIGKELTKIPMPVNFSEPLSMLQRLTEDFEYSECLDKAANCDDPCEQLAYVAAFTVSSYANTTARNGKPFNPLLGETYECDRREDYGWRAMAEQVSHHPPMVATYTEGRGWRHWQEFTMSSKFRGKYLQIIPLGIAHIDFPKTGHHYTWRKVTTTVHNIIVGKLWVDNHGEMDITNHKTGDNCHLKYSAYSYFSRETPRKVTGVVTDSSGTARWVLQGTWDDKLECAKVLKTIEPTKGKTVYETGPTKHAWQRRFPPAELEKCYNFTQLAVELNEPEERVCVTDTRLRPDQRFMEEGNWDEANKTKVLLEEKQRAARRKREMEAAEAAQEDGEYESWQPRWFKKNRDSATGTLMYQYTQEYWQCKEKQDWSRCPDIYL